MAEASKYAVGIQLIMIAVAANSLDMAGMATFTALPMKGVTNAASVATKRTVVLFIWLVSIFNPRMIFQGFFINNCRDLYEFAQLIKGFSGTLCKSRDVRVNPRNWIFRT
jgi:hypothetical protein